LNREKQSTRIARTTGRPGSGLRSAILLILAVVVLGTIGYSLLEGWPLDDSLYMTVVTMTTVGYGDLSPHTDAGRYFTIGLLLASVGVAGFAVSRITAFIVEGELNSIFQTRRMDQRITRMHDHYILCGAGSVGWHVAQEFHKSGTNFVVIERNLDAVQNLEHIGDILHIRGDATSNETLQAARVEHARGLVATLSDDKENIFILLTARALNPNIRMIVRVNDDSNAEKLRLAGADEIISAAAIGGRQIASVMIRPTVMSFLEQMMQTSGEVLRIEEVPMDDIPGLVGRTLGEAQIGQRTGLLVLAILPETGGYAFNPGADTRVNAGDVLIVMGTAEQQAALRQLATGGV
jgi:voltage-gated potassium channel